MNLVLKFTASSVDEIEKAKGLSIESCMADNTINNLALLLSKSLVSENGITGVSRAVALSTIDEYLKEKDKDNLLLDITEALVRDGFLSRSLDVNKMREAFGKRVTQVSNQLENM